MLQTVSSYKKNLNYTKRQFPRDGTISRKLYDALMHDGYVVISNSVEKDLLRSLDMNYGIVTSRSARNRYELVEIIE